MLLKMYTYKMCVYKRIYNYILYIYTVYTHDYFYIYIYMAPPLKVYHFKLHKIGLGVPYINTL